MLEWISQPVDCGRLTTKQPPGLLCVSTSEGRHKGCCVLPCSDGTSEIYRLLKKHLARQDKIKSRSTYESMFSLYSDFSFNHLLGKLFLSLTRLFRSLLRKSRNSFLASEEFEQAQLFALLVTILLLQSPRRSHRRLCRS